MKLGILGMRGEQGTVQRFRFGIPCCLQVDTGQIALGGNIVGRNLQTGLQFADGFIVLSDRRPVLGPTGCGERIPSVAE